MVSAKEERGEKERNFGEKEEARGMVREKGKEVIWVRITRHGEGS